MLARHAIRYGYLAHQQMVGPKGDLVMNLAIDRSRVGVSAPSSAVARPHVLPIASGMWLLAAIAAGCSSADSQVDHPNIVGMTNTTPAYYSDGNITIYEVQTPVMMPMRTPNKSEAAKLGSAPSYLTSFGATAAPWVKVDDVQTTIRYTITNLDNTQNIVELLIDPWNPYVKYKPGIQIVSDEETLPDLSGYDHYYVLGPMQRIVGTIVPDDTYALAMELATVMNISIVDPTDPNGNGLFNHTFNLQNRSTPANPDPLISSFMPKSTDVPAMIGFDLGLRSLAPMNVAVEVAVDVQDTVGGKVIPANATANDPNNVPMKPPGATLSPPKVTPTM